MIQVAGELKSAVRDGVTLRYLDTGAGDPPLVFIHGWCCSSGDWRDQVPAFAPEHRIVAVDLRGHGASDKPQQDYTPAAFAEDVLWLMEELGIAKAVVIGHSMGGVIALNMMRQAPDGLRAAVFVDSPVVPLPEAVAPIAQGVLAGLKTPAYKDVAAGFVGQMMFTADADPALKAEIIRGMAEAPQHVMSSALANTLTEAAIPAGPLPAPVLYIQADSTPWDPEVIKSRYPGVQHERIHCGHFIQLERPAELNDKIRAFVKGL